LNIKFHDNKSSGSQVVPSGRTDMTNLTVAFRNLNMFPPHKINSETRLTSFENLRKYTESVSQKECQDMKKSHPDKTKVSQAATLYGKHMSNFCYSKLYNALCMSVAAQCHCSSFQDKLCSMPISRSVDLKRRAHFITQIYPVM